MSLLETYCIKNNTKGEFVIDFTTKQNVSVNYSVDREGVNLINVAPDAKGSTDFSKNFGNVTTFKFAFDQQDLTARKDRKPDGTIGG